jgi:hypothetical protein
MAKLKHPTFTVVNVRPHMFDLVFAGAFGKSQVTLQGQPPESDTDLLRDLFRLTAEPGKAVSLRRTIESINTMRDDVVVRGRHWSYNAVSNALQGRDDNPGPPLPEVTAELKTWKGAVYAGFAHFNGGPHLCVDVPNGNFTVTCRTSEGRKITFSFVPYTEDGPAKCVDVQHHTSGAAMDNGGSTDIPVQEVIAFTSGSSLFRSKFTDERPCTLMTVLLATKEEREVGKQG